MGYILEPMKLIWLVLLFTFHTLSATAEWKFYGQEYPPINYTENGKIKGAMVDIILDACQRIKEKCGFEIWPLKRLTLALKSGRTPMVMTLIRNEERNGYALPTIPIYSSYQILWLHKDTKNIQKLEDLKGWKGYTVASSGSKKVLDKLAKDYPGLKVGEERTIDILFKKLGAGRYEKNAFVLTSDLPGLYSIKKNKITTVKPTINLKIEKFVIYFNKEKADKSFYERFNKQLTIMANTGIIKEHLQANGIQELPKDQLHFESQ